MTGIKIPVSADIGALTADLGQAEAAMSSTAKAADGAASKIDSRFASVADGADTMASKSSQAAGALGDLAGVAEKVGMGGLASGMENAAVYVQGLAGASDALNLITESTIVKTLASKAAVVGKTVVDKAATVATKAMAAGQWALNAAMAANPLGLVVLALVALVGGLVIAYQKSETFRDVVDAAFGKVKDVASSVAAFFTDAIPKAFNKVSDAAGKVLGWVKGNWPKILAILTGPFGLAVLAIAKNWDTIKAGASAVKDWVTGKFDKLVAFVTHLPGRMTSAVAGLFDGIKNTFRSALNWVIDKWNNFSLSIDLPGILGGGSISIGTPNIPHLAQGGIVTGPTLALIGEGQHDEAVIPLDGRHGLGGNTYNLTVYAPVGASSADIGRALVGHIDAYERIGGRHRA